MLLLEAQDDQWIPLKSKELLWDLLRKSEAQVEKMTFPGGHLQPGADHQIQLILEALLKWSRSK